MLLAVAIDAPSGRGDTAAVTVPMMLPLLLVELLLQLHVAQPSIHQSDQVLMHPLVFIRCRRQLTPVT